MEMKMKKDTYQYLNDPRALAEIRKHQGIESQKRDEIVGFATAAVDWIKKYGEQWKQIHVYRDNSFFLEKRRYRRFKADFALRVTASGSDITAKAMNISFFGLLFKTPESFLKGEEISVKLAYNRSDDGVYCRGMIERISQVRPSHYEVFLKFNDPSQKSIEQWQYLQKLSDM